jgi:hypothetical protein
VPQKEHSASVLSASQPQSIDTVIISGLLAEKDVPRLIESSDAIVSGTVVSKDSPIKIRPVSGGDNSLFTDYYVEIETVFTGVSAVTDGADSSVIAVRVQGGTIDELNVIVEEAPALEVGETHLLFLYNPGHGGGYNTAGEYFYVTGASQGAYAHHADGGDWVSQFNGSALSFESLQSQISEYESLGTQRQTAMDAFIQNQLRNLENGVITEEEYESLMTDANTYATVIE